jgi:hypothetical protein
MAVFWVVAQCSLVDVYRRFSGACCLHHQGDRKVLGSNSVAIIDNTQDLTTTHNQF